MRGKFILAFVFSMGISILSGSVARAQDQPQAGQPSQAKTAKRPYAFRETDIGGSIYNAFTSASTGTGVQQTPSNAIGGLFELRHIQRPLVGYEISFGYNSANAKFTPTPPPSCGYACNAPPQSLASKGYLVGLDWIFSRKFGRLRPFAVGGIGFFIDEPNNSVYPINDVVRITWTYGGGVDWALSDHFGLRAQYRGNVYSAPNLAVTFPATGKLTSMNQPMGGVFYTF
jgi:opacity protein-like surface antigen